MKTVAFSDVMPYNLAGLYTLKMEAADSMKHWYLSTILYCVTSQKTVILIFTAMGTSDFTSILNIEIWN
jgi:hypothetical protein